MLINKYSKMYKHIIKQSQSENRKKTKEGVYYEDHHILAQSLYPRFKNLKRYPWNSVLLTAREHFLCHWLLTKCYAENTQARYKMCWAFHKLAFSKQYKDGKRIITSAQYEVARKAHANNMKLMHPSKNDPEWSKKASERTRNSWVDADDRRLKMSERTRKYYYDNEVELKARLQKQSFIAAEASAKLRRGKKFPGTGQIGEKNPSAAIWEIHCPDGSIEVCRGNISKFATEHELTLSTLTNKKRQGISHKGYFAYFKGYVNPGYKPNQNIKKIKCSHCDVFGAQGNITRWHNNNCKHNPNKKEVSDNE